MWQILLWRKKRNNPVWCGFPSPSLVPPVSSDTPHGSLSPVSGSVKVLCLPVQHFIPSWRFSVFCLFCDFPVFVSSLYSFHHLPFKCAIFASTLNLFVNIISAAELPQRDGVCVSSLGSRGFFKHLLSRWKQMNINILLCWQLLVLDRKKVLPA